MKKLVIGCLSILVLSIGATQSVLAQLAVDGLHGVETHQAIQNNPELAAQYGLSPSDAMACTGGGGTTNCGASAQNVADFQAAVNAGGSVPSPGFAGSYVVKLQEPLSGQPSTLSASNGVDLIVQYISMIYMWMASIVGIIAVLMIVVAGMQIIFGGANTELISQARERITQALLSLILLFGTALLLKTINPNFFGFI